MPVFVCYVVLRWVEDDLSAICADEGNILLYRVRPYAAICLCAAEQQDPSVKERTGDHNTLTGVTAIIAI